ncbi:hypothetical protein NEFER03_1200 [Nematocida sp. LUAm3]|nr:hypothetical protein NEFER03_1200 [Nematocida sp. LUAm3]KAI5175809.1 hypothetical protein NEFER02_1678 [Nematocida sp. LUAm2]KAI5178305.1 hypothetical protein NEFER01_1472 [Nematocida sp. LUAm1]
MKKLLGMYAMTMQCTNALFLSMKWVHDSMLGSPKLDPLALEDKLESVCRKDINAGIETLQNLEEEKKKLSAEYTEAYASIKEKVEEHRIKNNETYSLFKTNIVGDPLSEVEKFNLCINGSSCSSMHSISNENERKMALFDIETKHIQSKLVSQKRNSMIGEIFPSSVYSFPFLSLEYQDTVSLVSNTYEQNVKEPLFCGKAVIGLGTTTNDEIAKMQKILKTNEKPSAVVGCFINMSEKARDGPISKEYKMHLKDLIRRNVFFTIGISLCMYDKKGEIVSIIYIQDHEDILSFHIKPQYTLLSQQSSEYIKAEETFRIFMPLSTKMAKRLKKISDRNPELKVFMMVTNIPQYDLNFSEEELNKQMEDYNVLTTLSDTKYTPEVKNSDIIKMLLPRITYTNISTQVFPLKLIVDKLEVEVELEESPSTLYLLIGVSIVLVFLLIFLVVFVIRRNIQPKSQPKLLVLNS